MKNSVFLLNGVLASLQGSFKIEKYQRFFVWEKRQIEKLYNDILTISMKTNVYDYYLQTISYYIEDNVNGIIQIVDGQQRITNLFLILLAYHNVIENYEHEYYEKILFENRDTIKHYFLKNIKKENKLLLQNKDNKYLKLIYDNSHDLIKKENKNSLLINAYLYYYNSLLSLLKDDIKLFISFYTNGLTKLSVIIEECNNLEEAAQCFINKNAKGKIMDGSDIIISNLYFLLYNKKYSINEINDLTEKIEIIRLHDDLNLFIQRFLYYKKVRVDTIKYISHTFSEFIDENVENGVDLKDIINDIFNYYKFENDFINDKKYKNINFELYGSLLSIASDVLFKINDDEVTKHLYDILNVCEGFFIRRTIINNTPNKSKVLFDMIEKVYKKDENIVDSIKKFLNDKNNKKDAHFIFASNDELKYYFLHNDMYKQRDGFTKFILNKINNFASLGEGQYFNEDTIEHILPKSKSNSYIINTIGNLTILNRSMNSKLSNKDFIEKKQLYNESVYRLNRYFDNINEWDEDKIKERSEFLSEIAIKIWDL